MIKRIKITKLDMLATFIIIIGPMFTQYSSISSVILLPELFILPLLVLYFIRYKSLSILNLKRYFLYFFIALLLTLINVLVGTSLNLTVSTYAFLRHVFYAVIIVSIGHKNFNIDYAAKVLIVVALLNSFYGFIQYFAYKLTGIILPWHFDFLPVKYGTNLIENSTYFFNEFGYRFSGLFSEPAHFSQYVSIALLVILFYKSDNFNVSRFSKIVVAVVFILALLLNGSGTGFAMIVFVMALFIVNNEKKTFKNVLLKIFFIVLGIIFLVYIINNQILNVGLDRILSISDLSSGNIRIFRPFQVFSSLPVLNKIIGIGYANYREYVINSSLATAYELSINSAWTNTFGYILVGSGILGFLFYICFVIYLFKSTKYFYRYLVILILLFALFTEVPLSFQFITIMGFINRGSLVRKSAV